MRRPARLLLLTAIGLAAAFIFAWARPYDPEPWLADLATLEAGADAAFANLEWHLAHGVDPVALHRRTDSAIRHARSGREARAALRRFAAAFHDGHFAVVRPMPGWVRAARDRWRGRTDAAPTAAMSGEQACAAIGYVDDAADASLLARAPGYRTLAAGAFEAGVITGHGGPVVGVVRIGSFGVDRFRAVCARAWPRVRDSLAHPACDAGCQQAMRIATGNALLADLRRSIEAVRAAGAEHLVVDLTGNGGGSEWVDPAARQFSARPLQGQDVGFVRHPHWRASFEEDVRVADSALGDSSTDAELRPALASARLLLDSALADIATPCDRSAHWRAGLAGVTCRQLVTGRRYTTGAVRYLEAGLRDRPGAELLFWPASYDFVEGAWDGPLALLVDGRTASASEQFVALLRDAKGGVVVGSRTTGAGCGMTNGGIPLTLPHSGLEVRMPDCARLRMDGTNEVAGITPDMDAGWADEDDDAVRADKALAALRRAFAESGP
jgi:hypothetical protein